MAKREKIVITSAGEVPYNLPNLDGNVILLFSAWPRATSIWDPPHEYQPHCWQAPTPTVRAGSITGVSVVVDGGATSVSVSTRIADGHSILTITPTLNDGRVSWLFNITAVNAQDAGARWVAATGTLTLCVTTSDVYAEDDDEDDEDAPATTAAEDDEEEEVKVKTLFLRGGTFKFKIAWHLFPRDLPMTYHGFLEFKVGEKVDYKWSMSSQAFSLDPYGASYGTMLSADAPAHGQVICPGNYDSGLVFETYDLYDGEGKRYSGGVHLHGTAMRPGVYLLRVFSHSTAIDPASDGSGSNGGYFPGGDCTEMLIVSIRPATPLPGDLLVLVPYSVATVPDTYCAIVHSTFDVWAQEFAESKEPGSWVYSTDTWDDSRPGGAGTTDADLLAWLASLLGAEKDELDAWAASRNDREYSTGHLHHPGYWLRFHREPAGSFSYSNYWYIIVRDKLNDDEEETRGVWRLYFASDVMAEQREWRVLSTSPELGLKNEQPPRYWQQGEICIKGAETYLVPDHGVFSYVGDLDVALPLPEDAEEDAEPEVVTVRCYQQQPLHTTQHDGWTPYYPPRLQYTEGKLLYEHPLYGWVMVPALTTEITAENAKSYAVTVPVTIDYAAIPYQVPAAETKFDLVGEPPAGVLLPPRRRDIALVGDHKIGVSVGNLDREGWNGQTPLALLGKMAAAGMFAGGVIWPNYPLTRMVHFERLRLRIHASAQLQLLGGNVGLGGEMGVGGSDEHGKELESSAHGDPSSLRYGKSVKKLYYDSSITGSCSASLDADDIPCWYNGYFLAFDGGGMPATTFSGGASVYYTAVQEFHSTERSLAEVEDEQGNTYRKLNGRGNEDQDWVLEGPLVMGSVTAVSCTAAVRMHTTLGHGREVNLCPVVMQGGGDRPREAVVFAGSLGVSFEWKFRGGGKRTEAKYKTYDVRMYEEDENGNGHWRYLPRPEDGPESDAQLEVTYASGSDWDSGLQVWKLPGETGSNTIRGEYDGVYKRYSQQGSYWYIFDADAIEGGTSSHHSASGWCTLTGGSGTVSGRSVADGDDSPKKYPLTHYSGRAECETTFDGATAAQSCDGENAADAFDAYAEAIENCDADEPAIADYPGSGHYTSTEFTGSFAHDHRIEHAVLEVTLYEI
jgi:hypothetical protein